MKNMRTFYKKPKNILGSDFLILSHRGIRTTVPFNKKIKIYKLKSNNKTYTFHNGKHHSIVNIDRLMKYRHGTSKGIFLIPRP